MEFPRHPSRRQRRNQQDVSLTIEGIKGMQDIFLEVSEQRLEEIARLGEFVTYSEIERGPEGPL